MDGNNWRPTTQGVEPVAMDAGDWRNQLQQDSRQRIVNKIMETLKRHLRFSGGQEGLQELKKIAVRFEEKIYTAATSQSDYLRIISLKMLTMETKSPNTLSNAGQSNSAGNSKNSLDPALQSMSQVNNQGQQLPISVPANQQVLSQNLHNNITQTGVPDSSGLTSSLPPVSSLSQTTMQNFVGSNSNLQNTQNISGVAHNSVENTMGQGVPANMFANSQRWQQQPQGQNQQHYLYQQPLQQQLMKPKFPQGNIPHSLLQSQMQQQQQQQQQNLLQQSQLQSSQQPVMQSSQLSNVQQNQQNLVQQSSQPVLQQHPQSVLRQQRQQQQSPIIHQQQQQPILPTQQHQQHLMGQLPNATNMQQNQLMGQPNSIPDMQQQQQQQQQRFLSQQNNLSNLQQQQLMAQQNNNLPNMHQQQLGPQNDVNGLQEQQQQLLGTQSINSSMLTNQHTVHMVQSQPKVPVQQQTQQSTATMMPIQGQQSQPLSQQQMMSHMQSQPGQVGMQQQPNPLQRDMQQRIQASGTLLPQQNVIDQQKQLFQPQRAIPEASSASLDSTAQTGNASGGDLQEEIYQKIKTMKDMYLADLSEMYQKIAGKLQQHDSLPQQPKNEQLEKLKIFKTMLKHLITFLQVPKSSVIPGFKDKLGAYEKQITNFLHSNRPRKPVSSMQQGQALNMHSMQQPQSQMTQMQNHDSQMNPQMQSMNLQGSLAKRQQNTMNSLQHNSLSPLLGVSNAQQSMMNSLLPSSTLDPGQSNALNTLQQVAVGSLQHDPVSGPQLVYLNPLSSQGGMNRLQPTLNPLQSNLNMAQHQHLKQQERMLQNQQFKLQYQQWQMQQQFIQKQQLLQLLQLTKQQQPAQLQANQMQQLHQMTVYLGLLGFALIFFLILFTFF